MTVEEIMRLADEYAYEAGADRDAPRARPALESAITKLAEDAERYQWLREYGPATFIHQWFGNDSLDAAIDKARTEARKG